MKKSIYIILFVLFTGCINDQPKDDILVNTDSLNNAKFEADSIAKLKYKAYADSILNLKAKKTVNVADKTVTVIQNAKTTNELKFEQGEYTYRSQAAERGETFLNIRIKLSSKSKWNNGDGNFLPNLNVFRVDKLNTPEYIETMTYQLYQKGNMDYGVLERHFDYKESEVFVCWLSLKTPLSGKYVISVNVAPKKDFDISTVIGIVNPN